jgi:hypothetical protein
MTDDEREQAAFDSIAAEISRLAHAQKFSDDEETCRIEEDRDMAMLFRAIPRLCGHNQAALAVVVDALLRLGAVIKKAEPRT